MLSLCPSQSPAKVWSRCRYKQDKAKQGNLQEVSDRATTQYCAVYTTRFKNKRTEFKKLRSLAVFRRYSLENLVLRVAPLDIPCKARKENSPYGLYYNMHF